jgi:Ring finger domain
MGDVDYDYILCEDCENLVPETSLVKHQAEACEARARPPGSFLPQTPLRAVQQHNANIGLTASADARLVRPIPSTTWSCYRCGRNNSQTLQSCEACQHHNAGARRADPIQPSGDNVNSRRNASFFTDQHAPLWNVVWHVGGHAQNPNVRHADPIRPSGDNVDSRRNASLSTNQHVFLSHVGGHFILEIDDTAVFSMGAALSAHQQNQQRGNRSYEELLRRFGNGAENMGASESDILSLPNTMISNVEIDLPEVNARMCCICLDDFQAGHMLTTLPCRHGFHLDCINKALRIRGRCPLCNATVKR